MRGIVSRFQMNVGLRIGSRYQSWRAVSIGCQSVMKFPSAILMGPILLSPTLHHYPGFICRKSQIPILMLIAEFGTLCADIFDTVARELAKPALK